MCHVAVHPVFCSIIPPDILVNIAEKGTRRQKEMAYQAMNTSAQLRGQRHALAGIAPLVATATGTKRRTIYDAQKRSILPGRLIRSEGGAAGRDVMANEAYLGSGKTYDFFYKVFQRNSIDDAGMRLESTVHYRRDYNNAMWNGQQMIYGDGDGQIFERFTKSLDVIGHELAHGVTQFEAGLEYQDQPGALNESFSDVFGSLVKQYSKRERATKADWLIGAGLFTKNIKGIALRSMKAPGTAYDDPMIGKDSQPGHMKDYVDTSSDNGGVHINSGIPNRAFYELSIHLGGYAWEKAGKIWYVTLRDKLRPFSQFRDCAKMTFQVAAELYGRNSVEQKAVKGAWNAVGVTF